MKLREPNKHAFSEKHAWRTHTCLWPGCTFDVPMTSWGCNKHWAKLPRKLQEKVRAVYRPTAQYHGNHGPKYLAVAAEIAAFVLARADGTHRLQRMEKLDDNAGNRAPRDRKRESADDAGNRWHSNEDTRTTGESDRTSDSQMEES